MTKKWNKIKEEVAYHNFRTIVQATYETPSGNTAVYDIMKDRDFAAVLALTIDNKVVIAKEYRLGPECECCDLPGGIIEKNETPEASIRRELLEETGYTGDFQFITRSFTNAYSTAKKYHFVATNCRKIQEPKMDPNEFVELVLMDLDKFEEEILAKGVFSDADTALYGLNYLKENNLIEGKHAKGI